MMRGYQLLSSSRRRSSAIRVRLIKLIELIDMTTAYSVFAGVKNDDQHAFTAALLL
jgi:hypothetical protein